MITLIENLSIDKYPLINTHGVAMGFDMSALPVGWGWDHGKGIYYTGRAGTANPWASPWVLINR